MHITGSLIAQYIHCKRQAWLFFHNIKTEHTSQNVRIGKHYHETRHANKKHTEIAFDGIKIDQIEGDTVVEYKKARTHPDSARYQLLYYLYQLKQKGIIKKGKIIFKENKGSLLVTLNDESQQDLLATIAAIQEILGQSMPPAVLRSTRGTPAKECKGCSYFDFCHIA